MPKIPLSPKRARDGELFSLAPLGEGSDRKAVGEGG